MYRMKNRRQPVPREHTPAQRTLPLTAVRSSLSPLLKQLEKTQGTVGIAIHGKIRGYLVPQKAYEALRIRAGAAGRRRKVGRPALYGSLTLVGDLEEGSRGINEALEESVARSAEALR
jgi:hypothetical protein